MRRTDPIADVWRYWFPERFGMDRETLAKMAMMPELLTAESGVEFTPAAYQQDIDVLREHILTLVNDHAESARVQSQQTLDLQKKVDSQFNQIQNLADKFASVQRELHDTKLKLAIEVERYNELIDKVLKSKNDDRY